jgi:hypothetical protein
MTILQDRLSDTPIPAAYLAPDDLARSVTTDWEKGPVGISDTSGGMNNQDWKLEFAAGQFTVIPQTTGAPVIVLTGNEPLDSIQCTFCFDQNARPMFAWVDSTGAGKLYFYSTLLANFVTITFEDPVTSVALSLDDKREKQIAANDVLLWYTVPSITPGEYVLYHRKQRDRFIGPGPYEMANPAPLAYLIKSGMHEELRGQVTLSNLQY